MATRYLGLNLFRPSHGVSHFDEVLMLFRQHALPYEAVYDEQDEKVSQNMVKMVRNIQYVLKVNFPVYYVENHFQWTNFGASVGDPTPEGKEIDGVKWEK